MRKTIILLAFQALLLWLVVLFRMPTAPGLAAAQTPSTDTYVYMPSVMNKYEPPTPTPTPTPRCIYSSTGLCRGYDIGVDDSAHRRDWLADMGGYMRMNYPGGLEWGAVFITMGPPKDPPRPGQDFSMYNTLALELKGTAGNECVNVGMKDNTDPDTGIETKKEACVQSTNKWEPFTFSLSDFKTADLARLYVVTEFVFEGANALSAKTVDFRNIQYLFSPAGAAIPACSCPPGLQSMPRAGQPIP